MIRSAIRPLLLALAVAAPGVSQARTVIVQPLPVYAPPPRVVVVPPWRPAFVPPPVVVAPRVVVRRPVVVVRRPYYW